MANRKKKMIPIDGERFKNDICHEFGTVRNYAKSIEYSYRSIYNYIKKNSIPIELFSEVEKLKSNTDSDSYRKGYEKGYLDAFEEMSQFITAIMGIHKK